MDYTNWACTGCGNINPPNSGTCLGCARGKSGDWVAAKLGSVSFTMAERDIMLRSPFWAFLVIANADGKVDKSEIAKFNELLHKPNVIRGEFSREISSAYATDQTLPQRCIESGVPPLEGLRIVGNILSTKPDNSSLREIKDSLILIGIEVAKASGEWPSVLWGEKVSDLEKWQLLWMHHALRMAPPVMK